MPNQPHTAHLQPLRSVPPRPAGRGEGGEAPKSGRKRKIPPNPRITTNAHQFSICPTNANLRQNTEIATNPQFSRLRRNFRLHPSSRQPSLHGPFPSQGEGVGVRAPSALKSPPHPPPVSHPRTDVYLSTTSGPPPQQPPPRSHRRPRSPLHRWR